ncbi:MAG TPA: cupin domain-containing protein [Gaiellaceae bacterium]|nr:cupin domain-containing protein [Gaiellaceae bacterium]
MKAKPAPANVPDAPSDLGPRLRAIRLRQGIGLRELARRLDLSPSSISQIETGKIRPSVRTLYALASAFGVTVDEVLFNEPPPPARTGPAAAARTPTEPGLTVQRAAERPAIALNSGVKWERLMFWADEDVEFLEATYLPGGASSPDDSFVRHNGHEFGHVLSGTLRVVVGFDEFVLEAGDSITFPSSTPHRLSNDGTETVRAVWVVRGRRGPDGTQEVQEQGLGAAPPARIETTRPKRGNGAPATKRKR